MDRYKLILPKAWLRLARRDTMPTEAGWMTSERGPKLLVADDFGRCLSPLHEDRKFTESSSGVKTNVNQINKKFFWNLQSKKFMRKQMVFNNAGHSVDAAIFWACQT